MKTLLQLVCLLTLLPLLATIAICRQDNLSFVDQSGKPIPDVIVRANFTATPPAGPGGTFELKSDANGKLTIAHPCGPSSGSCCFLNSAVSYTVLGKFGYQIGGGGSVACGFSPIATEITITGNGQEYPRLSSVSAANYREPLSGEMLVAAFGSNLATTIEFADLPLPTILGGRRVFLRNSDGAEVAARLLFVSSGQINFIVPSQSGSSYRTLIVRDENNQVVSVGFPTINQIAPGIFTANANGQGVPAAVIVRVRSDGSQQYEPVSQFDQAVGRFVPLALDLGTESEIIVLALFGTGWRSVSSLTNPLTVKIGGIVCPVEYVGKQPTIEGLDQLNVRLPRTLAGKGEATVDAQFGSISANAVQLKIK